MADRRTANDEGWHLDKKVPISMIVFLLMQTISFTWYMARQDARITMIETSRIDYRDQQHDRDDRQDKDALAKFEQLRQSVTVIDGKIDRLIERGK